MYWKVIDQNRFKLLKKVIQKVSLQNYYLAGGTALALQTGIRESFDFDFFVQDEFDETALVEELSEIGELEITVIRKGTLHLILNNIQFTFLYFPNKMIENKVATDEIKGLYLANIFDIAMMKLIAISQRGTKKDFFDLYYICHHFDYTIEFILEHLNQKYGDSKINYAHIIKSLSYFDDAEDENLPKVFIQYDWDKIKRFYELEQEKIYAKR